MLRLFISLSGSHSLPPCRGRLARLSFQPSELHHCLSYYLYISFSVFLLTLPSTAPTFNHSSLPAFHPIPKLPQPTSLSDSRLNSAPLRRFARAAEHTRHIQPRNQRIPIPIKSKYSISTQTKARSGHTHHRIESRHPRYTLLQHRNTLSKRL